MTLEQPEMSQRMADLSSIQRLGAIKSRYIKHGSTDAIEHRFCSMMRSQTCIF